MQTEEKWESDEQEYYQMQPLCEKGHKLRWMKSCWIKHCRKCDKKSNSQDINCRWFCQICDLKYCVKCMAPPIYGSLCPIGHNLNQQMLSYNICDSCEQIIKGMGYRDISCDFDLCQNCLIERED